MVYSKTRYETRSSPNFRGFDLNSIDYQRLAGIRSFRHHSRGSGDGRHLLEDGRQGDAHGAADRIDGRAGSGAQSGPAAVLFDVDFTEIGEIVDDALPFEPAAAAARRSISS